MPPKLIAVAGDEAGFRVKDHHTGAMLALNDDSALSEQRIAIKVG
jgi:hypothetical protein